MLAKADVGPGRIVDPAGMLTYVLAGNATFTLRGKKDRHTYRVRKAEDAEVWFVQVLSGPDNDADYVYVGIIRDGAFSLTKKSKATAETPFVKAFRWFWGMANLDPLRLASSPLEFWHEGRCCRCARKLTVPSSIESGIGPECAKIMECA